ncbi:hypothetical protein Tco_1055374 [Tanacetum coccineum]|uniref:Uncharacterized protein n=1 Tax=Tanacetum coccineum TaxID=301880 RepID=A0ABQ5GZF4_9ASTR
MGHRWLCSKTISVSSHLLELYFVGGGLAGALHCMKWFGMSCDLDPSHIKEAFEIASLHTHTPKLDVIQCLEKKLGYEFKVKGLLAGVDGWLPEIVVGIWICR